MLFIPLHLLVHLCFVFKGRVIVESNMLDLVKSITAPHTIRDEYRPHGWNEFLDAFALLNVPFSTISNPQVKRAVEICKRKSPTHNQQMLPKMTTKKVCDYISFYLLNTLAFIYAVHALIHL